METIATDALLLVTARYREAADRGPQHGMERRIETPDLHQVRSKRKQRSCRRQARLLVQRRHRGQARQFVDGLARQPYRRNKLRSAMHDAMPDRGEATASCLLIGPLQDIVQNVRLLPGCGPVAVKDASALHVL